MNFASDSRSGFSAQVLARLSRSGHPGVPGYGSDPDSLQARQLLSELFERELTVHYVATGTASNGLALSCLVEPWEAVLCHAHSHLLNDESSAPEMFTGGSRLIGLEADRPKLTSDALEDALRLPFGGGPRPAALSISQLNEYGLAYSPQELSDLSRVARAHGLRLHMDGSRFANALAALGCSPSEASWRSGIDVLSLGGTKLGCIALEAVIFFDPSLAARAEARQKRAGHSIAKSCFHGSQMLGWLEHGHWLELATRANQQARRLASLLGALPDVELLLPVHGNELFLTLNPDTADRLRTAGVAFLEERATPALLPQGLAPERALIRLVCSFSTTSAEIDGLATLMRDATAVHPDLQQRKPHT